MECVTLEDLNFRMAYKVGEDHYFDIVICDDGFKWTLYDQDFDELEYGFLENIEISLSDARNIVLDEFDLLGEELEVVDFEEFQMKIHEVKSRIFEV